MEPHIHSGRLTEVLTDIFFGGGDKTIGENGGRPARHLSVPLPPYCTTNREIDASSIDAWSRIALAAADDS